MVTLIGEILVDMIGREKDGTFFYERRVGGAPFNVAMAISKLGGHASFVGSVGNDIMGTFLQDYVNHSKLDNFYLNKVDERNTTMAFVNLASDGERSFSFFRKNTADYVFSYPLPNFVKDASIVHLGSLMLSEDGLLEFMFKVISDAHKNGQYVSFDVNYRSDIFSNKEEAINKYKKIIELADIVKFSEDEVEIFTKEYVDSLSNKLLAISLGDKGSYYRYNLLENYVPSIKVSPVDTTGAGDAFFGAILSQIDGYKLEQLNKEQLDKIFAIANITGSLNTLGYGAVDNLPSLEKVLSIYSGGRDK